MRWQRIVGVAVVVVLLAAAFVAGREVNDHDDPSSEATTAAAAGLGSQGFAQLPTVKCKTGLGVQQPAVPLDARTVVAIPAADASGLSAYRNSAGTTLVAPSGFQCEAGIGVDGSEHVTVFPRGSRNPAEYPQRSGTVVTLDIARACQGCIAEAVCTYFPEAKPVDFYYGGIEGQECPSKPLREEASYAAKSTVIFYDPPNVEGAGVGSGGPAPSLGAVSYAEGIGVRKVSCTLPTGQAEICAGIVGATFAVVPLN